MEDQTQRSDLRFPYRIYEAGLPDKQIFAFGKIYLIYRVTVRYPGPIPYVTLTMLLVLLD